jgi:hypothetical protein
VHTVTGASQFSEKRRRRVCVGAVSVANKLS